MSQNTCEDNNMQEPSITQNITSLELKRNEESSEVSSISNFEEKIQEEVHVKTSQCSHSNFKLGVFILPKYKICGYEVKFTGMTFYLEKVIGRNGLGPK